MGARTCMLVVSTTDPPALFRSAPQLDEPATLQWLATLFPKDRFEALGATDIGDTSPRDKDVVNAGCFAGLSVAMSHAFAVEQPSRLPAAFAAAGRGGTMHLHAMHSVVDWCAFAVWSRGRLLRSLSVAPDKGVIEDIGARLPFEAPYWDGRYPVDEDVDAGGEEAYPLPFHPLELGAAALQAFFGFQVTLDPDPLDAATVPLLRFRRSSPRWKFWT